MNKGVPQGSAISPSLFNVYLEEAIFSSRILRKAVDDGKLLAFADDLLITADSEEEMEMFLQEFQKWEESFGLIMNRTKTVWMSNRYDLRGKKKIQWVERVEEFKYLGINCSLSVQKIR